MEPYEVIIYPMMGEKATGMREKENKLAFVVSQASTKKDIKDAIEKLYSVKVESVQTVITGGKKKAYIRLDPKNSAEEVASKFGVI